MLMVPVYAIGSSEVGEIQITIKDPNKHMWKGKYQTGKLAIYFAEVIEGTPKIPIIPLIYILTEQDIPELNLMGYQVYDKSHGLFELQADLMHVIDAHYKDYLLEYKKENVQTLSLH